MGKLFKILGALIGLIVLLLVAAVVILPMVVDPNDYKDEIVTKVQEQTGRQLNIDGDLKLSVFPWLGIEIGGMQLSNAPGFDGQSFAAVKHAVVRVKLMPLLSSKLEVDTIGLEGLELNLAKSAKGVTNWDDLAKGGKSDDRDKDHEGEGRGLAAFTIGGVDISNAKVTWDDQQTGQHFAVDLQTLKSGSISPGRPVGLEMSLVLKSKSPQVAAKVQLTGEVSMDEGVGQIRVADLKVNVDAEGEMLAGGALRAELQAAITAALDGKSVSVDGLKLVAGDLNLSGDLKGRNLDSKQPVFSGKLDLAEFNLRSWMGSQGLHLPEMADEKALTRFSAAASLSAGGDTTKIGDLKLGLDDTSITGEANLRGPAIGFNLNVDSIDADRYLPPKQEEGQAETARGTGDEPLLPVETLRGLNLNGTVKIDKLIINKLLAEQMELTVRASQGKITLGQKVGKFYQGSYQGRVDLNVAGKTPVIQVEKSLSNLEAGPLLNDLTGKDKLTGKGNFSANLNTRGNSINAMKAALDGNLKFSFADGAVKGFNLAQTLRETQAKFKGETLPPSDQPTQTDFSELSGSGVITRGILANEDLLAKSPFLRVNGAGKVNLVQETLDYKVKTVIVGSAVGQGGEGLENLKGVPIPVHLTGPYASPDYSVDWGAVLTGTQKAKIEEKKEEVKQKVQEKLQNKLQGLFR